MGIRGNTDGVAQEGTTDIVGRSEEREDDWERRDKDIRAEAVGMD